MKKWLLVLACCLLGGMILGCSSTGQPASSDPSELDLPEIFQFEISSIRYVDSVSDTVIAEYTSPEDIDRILAAFSGWDMESARVPADQRLDLMCTKLVHFDDKLTIGLGTSTEHGYYGTIEGVAYYLPQAFADFFVSEDE